MSWTTTTLLVGFVAGIGVVIDRFILLRHKHSLHFVLVRYWNHIDDWKIRNMPKHVANLLFQKYDNWLSTSRYKRIFSVIFISWIVTSIAYVCGSFLDGHLAEYSLVPLPIFTYYIINFIFDLLTILVTLKFLRVILKRSIGIGFLALIADALAAVTLAAACSAILGVMDTNHGYISWVPGVSDFVERQNNEARNAARRVLYMELSDDEFSDNASIEVRLITPIMQHFFEGYRMLWEVPLRGVSIHTGRKARVTVTEDNRRAIYTFEYGNSTTSGWYGFFLSATTLIPTLVLLSLLAALFLSKFVLEISKKTSLYLLELATQADPIREPKGFIPFTLLGILLGVVAALLKLMDAIAKTS